MVTNIDPEHLDHYGTFDNARAAFRQFVENVPFYGFGVMCLDHPEVQALVGRIEDRKVITYGENPQADVRFSNVRLDGTPLDLRRRDPPSPHRPGVQLQGSASCRCRAGTTFPMPAPQLLSPTGSTCPEEAIRKGLADFGGVKRRFTLTGVSNGVQVFDDYGHHPVEIKAVLQAARERCKGRIIAVHQPHRFSRLASLFDDFANCFNDADTIFLVAGLCCGRRADRGRSIRKRWSRASNLAAIATRDTWLRLSNWRSLVAGIAQPGDFVVLLGAGNITQWAAALPTELDAISGKS